MGTESGAKQLHERSIVIDGLNVSRWGEEAVYRHLHQGGLTAINATVAVWEGTQGTLRNIARFYKDLETYSRYIRQVTCLDDIRKAKAEGRVGIIFGFQNSSPIADDLDLVEVFYRLGVRAIQITYNDLNLVGAGCYERQDVGLSQFGVDLVAEMNRLGMVIDLSHVGHRTTMDAIETSEDPVWFSHTNPRNLCEHPRNKTDEEVKALVAKGGIVGANSFPTFLARGYDSTLEDVLDVVDYWVDLVGIDSVGIGLDFTELHTAGVVQLAHGRQAQRLHRLSASLSHPPSRRARPGRRNAEPDGRPGGPGLFRGRGAEDHGPQRLPAFRTGLEGITAPR